jgi:hypothetical protein
MCVTKASRPAGRVTKSCHQRVYKRAGLAVTNELCHQSNEAVRYSNPAAGSLHAARLDASWHGGTAFSSRAGARLPDEGALAPALKAQGVRAEVGDDRRGCRGGRCPCSRPWRT